MAAIEEQKYPSFSNVRRGKQPPAALCECDSPPYAETKNERPALECLNGAGLAGDGLYDLAFVSVYSGSHRIAKFRSTDPGRDD